jgi:hypothetical protein
MKTTHTPGPWTLADENNANFEIQIGETICSLDRCSQHSDLKYVIERDEMIANGKLIMAAPDLLEALHRAKAMMERDKVGGYTRTNDGKDFAEKGSTYESVIAAIKKATE